MKNNLRSIVTKTINKSLKFRGLERGRAKATKKDGTIKFRSPQYTTTGSHYKRFTGRKHQIIIELQHRTDPTDHPTFLITFDPITSEVIETEIYE